MLTLEELTTTGEHAVLRRVGATTDVVREATAVDGHPLGRRLATALPTPEPAAHTQDRIPVNQVIEHVEVCDADWRLNGDTPRGRNILAIAPTTGRHLARDPHPVLRSLARRGVVAVAATAPGAEPVPGALLRAAQDMELPLLTPAVPCTAPELQTRILRALTDRLRTHAEQRGQLLGLAGRLYQRGEGPGPLLHWLGVQTSSQVTVITGRHTWGVLAEHARLLDSIMAGQIHSAAVQAGPRHVQLHGIGAATPRQVLAAVRDTPWPRHDGDLIAQAAGQVALLQQTLQSQATAGWLRRREMAVRVSVLQHLMTGETAQAARATEPLMPGLLTTPGCQVGVLECAPAEDRAAVAEMCEAELGPTALVVLCPVEDRRIIIVHSVDEGQDDRAVLCLLTPIVRARPGRALGVSRPVAWAHTSRGYAAAIQALARAREEEKNPVCVHDGTTSLAHRLSPSARAWAAELLAPVTALPKSEGDELLDIARLALAFGPTGAAKLAGDGQSRGRHPHRNTIARKLEQVAALVGLNRCRPADRAVLELALHLIGSPTPRSGTVAHRSVRNVLAEPAAQSHAAELLAPLRPDQVRLLTVWIGRGCRVNAVAEALGLHRNTVAARLSKASAALGHQLGEHGSGTHEVLLALCAAGALPPAILPTAMPGRAGELLLSCAS